MDAYAKTSPASAYENPRNVSCSVSISGIRFISLQPTILLLMHKNRLFGRIIHQIYLPVTTLIPKNNWNCYTIIDPFSGKFISGNLDIFQEPIFMLELNHLIGIILSRAYLIFLINMVILQTNFMYPRSIFYHPLT